MKKLFVLVSCFVVIAVLSKVSFAQSGEGSAHTTPAQSSVEGNVAGTPTSPQILPFGYPPYPTTVDGHPAYGIPYSYPRTPRRLFSRLAPPPHQPYPLPTPGAVPGPAVPPHHPPMVAPPMVRGQVPPMQGTLGVAQPAPAEQQGQPTVFYRPTPVRNFMTLIASPRPYIGYDPYAGYPPFPGYIPPQ